MTADRTLGATTATAAAARVRADGIVAPVAGGALAGLLFRAITGLRDGLGGQGAERLTS